jgi:hypothetical protein
MHSIDTTILQVLEEFVKNMKLRGGHVILCGMRSEHMAVFRNYGLIELIGPENCFEIFPGVFDSAKRALARARVLGNSPILQADLKLRDERSWAYEI